MSLKRKPTDVWIVRSKLKFYMENYMLDNVKSQILRCKFDFCYYTIIPEKPNTWGEGSEAISSVKDLGSKIQKAPLLKMQNPDQSVACLALLPFHTGKCSKLFLSLPLISSLVCKRNRKTWPAGFTVSCKIVHSESVCLKTRRLRGHLDFRKGTCLKPSGLKELLVRYSAVKTLCVSRSFQKQSESKQ